jgi:2-desacetyl-2-hydroxyethyl bacteriochlorophyllide A dehydrogenase
MPRQSLWFSAPRTVELREEPLPRPAAGQVLVRTVCSAISAGTELLIYRGEAPADLTADETISALGGALTFPLKYGYSAVGRIIALGPNVDPSWHGRLAFAFNPHESLFVASAIDLIPLPPDLDPVDAVFLPNMETAVNFLHDGAPLVGERVAVFGQGLVGLLTTTLLSRIPLASLVTLDRYPLRRELSLKAGAHTSLDSQVSAPLHDFDLCYELSGSPAALDQAIAATGFHGRIVIGSWYGTKRANLDLGGRFHRSRIRLISSQVSTLAPELTGRWTKARRLQTALQLLAEIRPSRFITHRIPFADAAKAYELLDQRPEETVQIVLTYT